MTQAELLDQAETAADMLRLDPRDDVAVALRPLAPGETACARACSVIVREPIAQGHKIALRDMAAGETVHKYGWPIGRLDAPVAAGAPSGALPGALRSIIECSTPLP